MSAATCGTARQETDPWGARLCARMLSKDHRPDRARAWGAASDRLAWPDGGTYRTRRNLFSLPPDCMFPI